MPQPKLDLAKLKKVCPYAAEAYAYILSEREKFAIAKVTIRDQAMEAIATRMLELEAENEKMKQGIDKVVNCFVGCDECKKKVKRQIEILDMVLAAHKGDPADETDNSIS